MAQFRAPQSVVQNRLTASLMRLMCSRVCIIIITGSLLLILISLGFYQTTTTTTMVNQYKMSDGIASTAASTGTSPRTSVEQVQKTLRELGMTPIYDESTVTDPWKVELFQRLDRIRIVCGKLCQMNSVEELERYTVKVPNAIIDAANLEPVDCPALLALEDIDASDSTAPPIPHELIPYFTFNRVVEITDHDLLKDIYLGAAVTRVWTVAEIDQIVDEVKNGVHRGTYGQAETNYVRDNIGTLPIAGKSILVIGTELPWVEAILLYHGAAKVTTLEYAEIRSEHDQIKTMQPHQFRERSIAGTLESFDGVVSHSSLEHSGLGRYGDALNPWGDILAVARAWCVTKPGGFLYLGLPTGKDLIHSNWHRIYGRIRWPLVAANWMPLPSTTNGKELDGGTYPWLKRGGIGYKFIKQRVA